MAYVPRAEAACPQVLLSGPIGRTLLFFALPALGTCVLQSISGSINAIWVGRLLGENAIAAISSASLITMAVSSIMFGLGSAVSALIGQATGRRDAEETRRVCRTALNLFLLAGLVLGALGCWLTPEILRWVGTPESVYPLAERYLSIHFTSLPATFLFVLLMMLLRGTGELLTPLWYMGLNATIDIALNPLLIDGFGVLPALGIEGSAIAGLIASSLSTLGLAAHIYIRRRLPRLSGEGCDESWSCVPILRLIVGKGSVMSLQLMVATMSAVALLSLVNQFGSATAAAYGAAMQLWTFIQMPASALAIAVGSMAALNMGAQQWDRLQAIARSGVIIALLIGTLIAAASLLFARPLLSLFLPEGESLETAVRVNRIGIWSMVIAGVAMVPTTIVRANGAVLVPLLVSIVSVVLLRLGFAFGLRDHLGSHAIWWGLVLGAVCNLLLLVAYYRHGSWRALRLVGKSRDAAEPRRRFLANGLSLRATGR